MEKSLGSGVSHPAQSAHHPARKTPGTTQHLGLKRTLAIGALGILTGCLTALCAFFGPDIVAFVGDPAAVRAWADGSAPWSQAAFVAVNVAQIAFAFIPGEPFELAAGYAFGFWAGTGLCLAASALGTALVVWAVRRWGLKVVNLFFSTERIESASWLRDAKCFEPLLFVAFLIPGIPKDLLTYIAGLGACPLARIVAITTIGRIPSIVSSTLAAGAFGDGNYGLAIGVASVTLALVVVGVLVWKRFTRSQAQTPRTPR